VQTAEFVNILGLAAATLPRVTTQNNNMAALRFGKRLEKVDAATDRYSCRDGVVVLRLRDAKCLVMPGWRYAAHLLCRRATAFAPAAPHTTPRAACTLFPAFALLTLPFSPPLSGALYRVAIKRNISRRLRQSSKRLWWRAHGSSLALRGGFSLNNVNNGAWRVFVRSWNAMGGERANSRRASRCWRA
jgi:hypothetical protein